MRELPQDDVWPYNGTVRPGEKCTLPRAADYSFLAGEDCAQRADHKTAFGGGVECDFHLDGRTGSRCAALPRAWHVSPLVRLEAHIPLFEKCDQLMSGFLSISALTLHHLMPTMILRFLAEYAVPFELPR